MESEGKDKKGMPADMGKARYCVLFVHTLKQWEVSEVIRRKLPDDKGMVFYPCAEYWMGSLGKLVIKPLFPGYVFIRSTLPRGVIHDYVRKSRWEVLSFISELRISRDRMLPEKDFEAEPTDLGESETELLDFLLEFSYGELVEETEEGKKTYRKKLPKAGVLRMSRGFMESDGSYVVMEGPLAGHGDIIVDTDARDRVAWLNFKVGGKLAKVGLELESKKRWFPQDRNAPVVLDDGFVLKPNDIAAEIMRSKS